MQFFLREALTGWDLSKAKGKTSTGEQRGGAYVARVQTGYNKDGKPNYRYFTDQGEYDSYLQGKGKKGKDKEKDKDPKKDAKKKGKDLKEKTEKETGKEKEKQSALFTAQAKKDKKEKGEKVKKSLPVLFIEVNDE